MFKFNVPDGLGTYFWQVGDYLECKWRAGSISTRGFAYLHFLECICIDMSSAFSLFGISSWFLCPFCLYLWFVGMPLDNKIKSIIIKGKKGDDDDEPELKPTKKKKKAKRKEDKGGYGFEGRAVKF